LAIERTSTLTSLAHAPMERERSSTAPSPAPLSRVSLAGAPSATAAMTTLEAPSVVQRVHDLGHGDRRAWAEQLGELADARDADEHSGGRGAVDDPDGAEHPRRGGQRRKDVEARLDAHPGDDETRQCMSSGAARQIPVCGRRIDVSEVGGQQRQAATDIFVLVVAVEHRRDREAVTQVVQPGTAGP